MTPAPLAFGAFFVQNRALLRVWRTCILQDSVFVEWIGPRSPSPYPLGGHTYGIRIVENDAKWSIWSVSWQPGLRMVENDAKFVDFESHLAAWGSECSKMTPNKSILNVSWHPGLRMIENDARA